MSRKMLRILGNAVLILVCAGSLHAQTDKGKVTGQVADPQGLVIANAKVHLVSQEGAEVLDTVSDETGHYTFANVAPGRYKLSVEAEGFNPFVSEEITVRAGQTTTLDAQLTEIQTKETVTVQGGGAAQVETSNAEVSGTLTESEVKTLGLNGRIAYQLIALVPGVSNQTGQDEGKTGIAGSAKYSVNGGRVEYNIFEVDGADVLNNGINAARTCVST